MAKQKIDLATLDKFLCDIVLQNYPGKIFEEQYVIENYAPGKKVYRFLELEKEALQEFLPRYREMFEYDLLDSKTGKLIESNKIGLEHFCYTWGCGC